MISYWLQNKTKQNKTKQTNKKQLPKNRLMAVAFAHINMGLKEIMQIKIK